MLVLCAVEGCGPLWSSLSMIPCGLYACFLAFSVLHPCQLCQGRPLACPLLHFVAYRRYRSTALLLHCPEYYLSPHRFSQCYPLLYCGHGSQLLTKVAIFLGTGVHTLGCQRQAQGQGQLQYQATSTDTHLRDLTTRPPCVPLPLHPNPGPCTSRLIGRHGLAATRSHHYPPPTTTTTNAEEVRGNALIVVLLVQQQ